MEIKYPVYRPLLIGNERKYINDCIDSTWISSKGKYINLFETSFAKFLDVKYSATCSNGTTALHLALLALGIGIGDEVIVPTLTYIATVNSIAYSGAVPVFVDSEKRTWNMDPDEILKRITKKTKAILVVHLYGHPAKMDEILNIAKKNKLFVIEDCAEAIGSKVGNKYVGTFGDIAAFSFYGNKTITTGEGGMVVSNKFELIEKVKHLKNQGVDPENEYRHNIIGYNFRMTNLSAAIGYAQMEQIDRIVSKKRQIADWYQEELKNCGIIFQSEQKGYLHSYWMCSILFEDVKLKTKMRVKLAKFGVETRPTFYPIHLMPMYKTEKKFIVAEEIGTRGINLPSYPELEKEDVIYISSLLK